MCNSDSQTLQTHFKVPKLIKWLTAHPYIHKMVHCGSIFGAYGPRAMIHHFNKIEDLKVSFQSSCNGPN